MSDYTVSAFPVKRGYTQEDVQALNTGLGMMSREQWEAKRPSVIADFALPQHGLRPFTQRVREDWNEAESNIKYYTQELAKHDKILTRGMSVPQFLDHRKQGAYLQSNLNRWLHRSEELQSAMTRGINPYVGDPADEPYEAPYADDMDHVVLGNAMTPEEFSAHEREIEERQCKVAEEMLEFLEQPGAQELYEARQCDGESSVVFQP